MILLASAGMTDKEIAAQLGLGRATVSQYVGTMMRKAGAASRSELVARCFVAGIFVSAVGAWPPVWSESYCLGVQA